MNIDEMEAGRELDALVAEKAMGWEWRRFPHAGDDVRALVSPESWLFSAREKAIGDERLAGGWNYNVPNYSTKIADAWEVVNAMRDRGLSVNINVDSPENSTLVSCSLHKPDLHETMVTEKIAETAPLAICLVALASAEGEK